MKTEYPGAGDYAALKIHKTFSIGRSNLVNYSITPAREHDGPHLTMDESWRGRGLVVDLGYASHGLLADALTHGVEPVVKLKQGWKTRITRVVRGTFIEGKRRDWRRDDVWWSLGDYRLRSERDVLDCDVEIDFVRKPLPMRFVALYVNGKTVYFLTTLTREAVSAELVGSLYRLRWNIELDNKLNKSGWVLAEIDANRPPAVRTLLLSSLLGSIIVNRIVHADHLHRAAAAKPPRKGPMHARLVALTLATAASQARSLTSPPTLSSGIGSRIPWRVWPAIPTGAGARVFTTSSSGSPPLPPGSGVGNHCDMCRKRSVTVVNRPLKNSTDRAATFGMLSGQDNAGRGRA